MKTAPLHDPDFDRPVIPPKLEEAILRELEGYEKVVWVGHSLPRPTGWRLWGIFAIGLGMVAFAIPLIAAGLVNGPAGIASGLALAGGGSLIIGALHHARSRDSETCYVLTDHRAIVREPEGWFLDPEFSVQSYEPAEIRGMYRSERPDGSGDLVFREIEIAGDWRNGGGKVYRRGFLAVADVREVERLVRSTLKGN